jgi:hypothetical protein
MNKRGMSMVGAMGILCLGGFAFAPTQAMPPAPGISAIHQIATGNDPLVQVRKKSARKRQPTSGGFGIICLARRLQIGRTVQGASRQLKRLSRKITKRIYGRSSILGAFATAG